MKEPESFWIPPDMTCLLIGLSVRALAESAVKSMETAWHHSDNIPNDMNRQVSFPLGCCHLAYRHERLVTASAPTQMAENRIKTFHDLICLDYFGDRDLQALCRRLKRGDLTTYSLAKDFNLPFDAEHLLTVAQTLRESFDHVVYTSNLENHPHILEQFEARWKIMGNDSKRVRKIRDWKIVRAFCNENQIAFPETFFSGEEEKAEMAMESTGATDPSVTWLIKPIKGGGGRGVRQWTQKPQIPHIHSAVHKQASYFTSISSRSSWLHIPSGTMLQKQLDGIPASAVFVADGNRVRLLGLTRQLIGEKGLGAHHFTWCGNIFPLMETVEAYQKVHDQVTLILKKFVMGFGLKGVGSLDFVLCKNQRPCFLEINPRYTGSMELLEQALGMSFFDLHIKGCEGDLSTLPVMERRNIPSSTKNSFRKFWGKGIFYTRNTIVIPDTDEWIRWGIKDVPFQGERIEAGRPVCTLFSEGRSQEACLENLFEKAKQLCFDFGMQ